VRMTKNIDYWGDGLRRHRLDVYSSRQTPPSGAPVMVYIHGGAWVWGRSANRATDDVRTCRPGLGVRRHQLSVSPKATWPAHIVDAKKRWHGSEGTSASTAETPASWR